MPVLPHPGEHQSSRDSHSQSLSNIPLTNPHSSTSIQHRRNPPSSSQTRRYPPSGRATTHLNDDIRQSTRSTSPYPGNWNASGDRRREGKSRRGEVPPLTGEWDQFVGQPVQPSNTNTTHNSGGPVNDALPINHPVQPAPMHARPQPTRHIKSGSRYHSTPIDPNEPLLPPFPNHEEATMVMSSRPQYTGAHAGPQPSSRSMSTRTGGSRDNAFPNNGGLHYGQTWSYPPSSTSRSGAIHPPWSGSQPSQSDSGYATPMAQSSNFYDMTPPMTALTTDMAFGQHSQFPSDPYTDAQAQSFGFAYAPSSNTAYGAHQNPFNDFHSHASDVGPSSGNRTSWLNEGQLLPYQLPGSPPFQGPPPTYRQ